MKEIPSFFKKPDPITDIADTKEYDIVVIGAGSPGVPCALKAAELGAKVAILQKEKEAAACGNFGAGILTELRRRHPDGQERSCRRGKVRFHARSCFRPQGQEGASRYVGQEIRRGRSLDD